MSTGAKGVDRAGEVMNTISSTMSASEIIAILTGHRCGDITGELDLDRCGRSPISGGGFGDVYQGTLKGGEKVAIKCARLYLQQDDVSGYKVLKRAARELHTWSRLDHENILSLLGLAQFRDQMAMVSPWMDNGTLLHYIGRYPTADRYQLCIDISDGVTYLHQNGTVHGDIKGANVLISDKGVAKLADFGCTEMNSSSLHFTTTTSGVNLSMRWAAPEILNGQGARSNEADVYALGMTFLEVVTGKVPFSSKDDIAVYIAVTVKLQIPDRPPEFPSLTSDEADQLWEIIVSSCAHSSLDRPGSTAIQNRVRNIRQHTKQTLHHYSVAGSGSSTAVEVPDSKEAVYASDNSASPLKPRDPAQSTDGNNSKKPDERGKGRGEEESEDEETDEEMDTGYAHDLLAPDREPNPARLYIPFEEFFIVEDLRELLQPQSPPLPAALVSHDVLAGEWDRCMLSMVRFTFQAVRSTGSGALDLLLDFVTQWNIKFFLPRGVDIGVYKGNSRRSGPVGMIDIRSKLRVFSNKLESASGVRKRLRGVSIRARVVIINPVAGPDSGTTPKEPAGKEIVYYDENSANPLPPRSGDENPDGAGLLQQIPRHETSWPQPFYLFEEFFVVEDLTELLHPQRPPLPAVLVPCDVMRDEWDRFMAGIVHFAFPTGRSTGSSVPGPLVGLIADWNIKFFLPRMVDVSIYKGSSRLSGPPSMITVKSGLRVLSSESESVSDAGRRQRGVSIRIRAVLINPMAGFDSGTTAKEPAGEEVVYDNENSANPLEPKDTTKSADDNHNKEPDEQGKGEEAEESEDENPDADDVGRFWPIPDRELNRAQPFTLFEEFFVVEDLVELLHPQRPPLPAVLVTHDVMRDEWHRCMESVIHLTFPGGLTYGGASDRLIDLITQWNIKFFLPRVVDIGIYKDNTRLSGPANMINIDSRSRMFDDEPGSKPSASGQQVTGVSIRVRAVPSNEPVFVPVAYSRLQMK